MSGLVRNVPGGVVMLGDPDKDVREITWPDVTASAYEESTRLDGDYNELVGNFSPAQMAADRGLNAPVRNMTMLQQSNGSLVEYLLQTYKETFVMPVLKQLMRMEQCYETDDVILSIAAKKANLWLRYNINKVTDNLLSKDLAIRANVGMGSTDPNLKLRKFLDGITTYAGMLVKPVPGLNMQEIGKEVFGHLGYQDGTRFFTVDDPQKLAMQQQLQQAMAMIQQLQMQLKEKMTGHQVKAQGAQVAAQTKLQVAALHEQHEDKRNLATHIRAIAETQSKHMTDLARVGFQNEANKQKPKEKAKK